MAKTTTQDTERDPLATKTVIRIFSSMRQKMRRKKIDKAHVYEFLGMDRDKFIAHLQAQFQAGQNWSNYGTRWVVQRQKPKRGPASFHARYMRVVPVE